MRVLSLLPTVLRANVPVFMRETPTAALGRQGNHEQELSF